MSKDLYPEIARLLNAHGWRMAEGGKGSHEKWRHPDGRVAIVPRTHSRHTANAIMKQVGLPKSF